MNKEKIYHYYVNTAISLNKKYLKWIFNSSKDGVDPELIFAIIVIEKMNRGSFSNRFLEKLLSVLCPSIIIKLNASIGLCQIRVRTAKKVVTMTNKKIVKALMSAEDSIDILTKLLKLYGDEIADDKINIERTVLNLYLTGKKDVSPNIYLTTYYDLVEYSIKNQCFHNIYFKNLNK